MLLNTLMDREMVRRDFLTGIDGTRLAAELFDGLSDLVFFMKDREGRYVSVNQAFVERVGLRHKDEVLGKRARDVYPAPIAANFEKQDQEILTSGRPVLNALELQTNRDRSVGWYLTQKHPLHTPEGAIAGVAGVSQDLHEPSPSDLQFASLAETIEFIQSHFADPLRIDDLARRAKLSPTQLDRRMKKIFRISTKQFITKTRIENASRLLLKGHKPIQEIAQYCGFYDQSAFSRQFKAVVGMTPRQYREVNR